MRIHQLDINILIFFGNACESLITSPNGDALQQRDQTLFFVGQLRSNSLYTVQILPNISRDQCLPVDVVGNVVVSTCGPSLRRFTQIIVTIAHTITNTTAATAPTIIGSLLFFSSLVDPPTSISKCTAFYLHFFIYDL